MITYKAEDIHRNFQLLRNLNRFEFPMAVLLGKKRFTVTGTGNHGKYSINFNLRQKFHTLAYRFNMEITETPLSEGAFGFTVLQAGDDSGIIVLKKALGNYPSVFVWTPYGSEFERFTKIFHEDYGE